MDGTDIQLTWKGRELQSYTRREMTGMDDDGNPYYDSTTYSYTYNSDGIRTSKTVNGITHEYILNGSQIVAETWKIGTIEYLLVYLYDEAGSPIGIKCRTSAYDVDDFDSFFFEKNLQGDIVAIYNDNGVKIGSYIYDAWGNHTYSVTSGVTTLERGIVTTYNPFRYRGYYYDVETGWYYLQTRYYNPNWCRFISADIYISTGQEAVENNMFAYCGNNPVIRADFTGKFWEELLATISQTFQQASGYFAVAAGVSQIDSPVPGPADVVSGALLIGGALVCMGIATYTAITAPAPTVSIPKAEEKAEAKAEVIPGVRTSPTVIYRYGGTYPGNLTPRSKDLYTGLFFSTVPMPGAAMTTIEAINATGVVRAVQDGATHVSVRPVGATMEDWIHAGSGSIWTQAVKSVVIKFNGSVSVW